METRNTIIAFAALALLIVVWIYLRPTQAPRPVGGTATTTAFAQTVTTPGGITFGYPASYGLAVTPEQILARAYIPPCDSANPGFDYCLYRIGEDFSGTNFESAGLRIKARPDLAAKTACLSTEPEGYSGLVPKTDIAAGYETSAFSPLGDAAAGHYATGALYRLHYDTTCYEFETRIGESQFANYPKGSIRQFTDADRAAVQAELMQLLSSVTIASSSAQVAFPAP